MALKKKKGKSLNKPKPHQPNRKQLRKEKRKEKKARRNDYYNRNRNPNKDQSVESPAVIDQTKLKTKSSVTKITTNTSNKVLTTEEQRKKEQKQQKNIEKQMRKQRIGQLKQENFREDQNIKRLEKQLKLHKRKTKALPKSFATDGLDYLLEVCDSENIQDTVAAEKEFLETNEDFEEDFALMTGSKIDKKDKSKKQKTVDEEDSDGFEDFLNQDDGPEDEDSDIGEEFNGDDLSDEFNENSSNEQSVDEEKMSLSRLKKGSKDLKRKLKNDSLNKKNKKPKFEVSDSEESKYDSDFDSEEEINHNKKLKKQVIDKKLSKKDKKSKNIEKYDQSNEESDFEEDILEDQSDFGDSEEEKGQINKSKKQIVEQKISKKDKKSKSKEKIIDDEMNEFSDFEEDIDNQSDFEDSEEETSPNKNAKKQTGNKKISKKDKKSKSKEKLIDNEINEDSDFVEDIFEDKSDFQEDSEEETNNAKSAMKKNADGTWEDIYGRLRNKDGTIVSEHKEGKYIPPAVRAKMEATSSEDKNRIEKLKRLKRQLKGLLNRLAESNMHSISAQIEELYMNNSRNDMNESLTSLILESLISNVIAPERLLMEHVLLITILHANVGTEVGAHFLQTVVKKFDEFSTSNHQVENKQLDNIVNILAQLYNFKLFDAKLLYEILQRLSESFEEKDVECILHILKNVGFSLRKDDPLALKSVILDLQKKAAGISDEVRKDNARVKFMLEILLAIKNNNVTKIPNYDTTYSEHLKKIMRGFIRKGNYVTQLNITLNDLLKADERGKWWVVGSAWTGNLEKGESTENKTRSESFSSKLLELARKQRMNTDSRRNIFCIIMSAEDYLDAFEKLLKLGLKNQQEREIIHVILHCCLQEKVYNPFYSVLAQKFCEYDRKYQMTIKYSVWDKLKALSDHSGSQISNLAKLLSHLFIEKGLPISTLKIVEFGELDKVTLRFMRQILLGILLHTDTEACLGVFEKVAQSAKLKMFRESLRLFIHHFLLKNLKSEMIPDNQKEMLQNRAKLVESVLTSKEGKLRF